MNAMELRTLRLNRQLEMDEHNKKALEKLYDDCCTKIKDQVRENPFRPQYQTSVDFSQYNISANIANVVKAIYDKAKNDGFECLVRDYDGILREANQNIDVFTEVKIVFKP